MASKAGSFILFLAFLLIFTGCANKVQPVNNHVINSDESSAPSEKSPTTKPKLTTNLSCNFYIPQEFTSHINSANPYDINGDLVAGVVPHHLLAGKLIASFFARASQPSYDTVIIIGPSHFANQSKAITANTGWNSPFGAVNCDEDFIKAISENHLLNPKVDNSAIEGDHAVGGLVPYVSKYLPSASLGVVLMANGTSDEFQRELSTELFKLSQKKKVLVVASIDFSHYLDPAAAGEHDKVTQNAVESFDFDSIDKMKDSNIDSPEAMQTLLHYLRLSGISSIYTLDHNSSDKILNLPINHPAFSEGTTTYFVFGSVG